MADLSELKKQIATVEACIAQRKDEPLLTPTTAAFLGLPYEDDQADKKAQAVADMQAVLATLQRLLPPF